MRKGLIWLMIVALPLVWLACSDMVGVTIEPVGETVAKVDGSKITDQQILEMLQSIRDPKQLAQLNTATGKRQLLDKIIDIELIAAAARSEGMEQDSEVRRIIDSYTKQVLFVAYLQKKMEELSESIGEEEAKAFYEKNKSDFMQPETINVRHIFLRLDADAEDAEVASAEQKAKKIYDELKAGADFAKMAEKHSEDPNTSGKGGVLGFIGRGRIGDEFDAAAFALADGEFSEPVRTKFGLHIIKVDARRPARQLSLDEAAPYILRKLRMQSQQDSYDDIIGPLRANASINVDEEAVAAIELPVSRPRPQTGTMPSGLSSAQPSIP